MILLQLFISFAKIGFTSFGGLSMIPLVADEMLRHGWMTAREVADIVAIAEMTPGPLGLNCATFAGTRTAGLAGAIAANLGVLAPTFTVGLAVAVCFARFRGSRLVQKAMLGIRPACIGMIAGVTVSLALSGYAAPEGGIDLLSLGIGGLALLLLTRFQWSVPKTICLSALLGLLVFGVLPQLSLL